MPLGERRPSFIPFACHDAPHPAAAQQPPVTARITPYELILEPLERTLFQSIRAEAEQRGSDDRRRDQFLLLGHAGAALREMVPDDAPPETLDEYSELLYHGYQFWSFGRRLYALDESVTALLTEPHFDMKPWELAGPPSCYLQFPSQRLWSRVAPEAPFEPADGCFVVVDDTAPAPGAGIHLRALLVLGMRPERAGVSLVQFRTDLDPKATAARAADPWRTDAQPFANVIPGGERKGFRNLATTSELEALVIRTLYLLDTRPSQLEPREGSLEAGQSRLPHVLVHA